MNSAKTHIEAIVKNYTRLYPEEWAEFKIGMAAVRASLIDENAHTSSDVYGARALYEMPETLQTMLIMGLTEEEMIWLKSGIKSNPNQGGRWFAKHFPTFAITNKI
jgi:hypothetical protein